jgi:murein DD-endopeptidase MepM/ murein hydrolase activator NlpD
LKKFRYFLIAFLFLNLVLPIRIVNGQSSTPDLPVYIVQPGDTINVIALKFNISSADLIAINNLADPNFLQVNTQLLIPGISGVSGVLTYTPVNLGETPISIARKNKIDIESLYKLNKISSPSEFFLGANIILVENELTSSIEKETTLQSGKTLMELSISEGINQWQLIQNNQMDYPWQVVPNDLLAIESSTQENLISNIQIYGLPLTQGKTASIIIDSGGTEIPFATLDNDVINFVPLQGKNIAIFGIYALKDPGLYPFHLEYTSKDGGAKVIDQMILVQAGYYPQDPVIYVDPETLDEAITKSEDDLLKKLTTISTPEKYWEGIFIKPVDEPSCVKSSFGNRRSYNDQPYDKYHTGVDYGVCANLNIYAPADGIVVFSGPLSVRGNATIIDHGMGVFSGFWHQSQIFVDVGQKVSSGDLIGEIGSTGRSTGPHLHWELIVNGNPVNPLDWLENDYP